MNHYHLHLDGADGSLAYCSEAIPMRGALSEPLSFGTCPHPNRDGVYPMVSVRPPVWIFHP